MNVKTQRRISKRNCRVKHLHWQKWNAHTYDQIDFLHAGIYSGSLEGYIQAFLVKLYWNVFVLFSLNLVLMIFFIICTFNDFKKMIFIRLMFYETNNRTDVNKEWSTYVFWIRCYKNITWINIYKASSIVIIFSSFCCTYKYFWSANRF